MTEEEFLKKVKAVDRELAEQGTPPFQRQFEIYFELSPDYNGPLGGIGVDPDCFPALTGPNLLKRIGDWLFDQYGEDAYMPNHLGRIPCLLRNRVYLIRIPICFGEICFTSEQIIHKFFEGLTPGLIRDLQLEEIFEIARIFSDGYCYVYEIEDMRELLRNTERSKQKEESFQMLIKAIDDRDRAIICLVDNFPDVGNALFHAQQHGEKMLKGFLLTEGITSLDDLKKYGHNLRKIFEKCLEHNTKFRIVESDIERLSQVNMDVRYAESSHNLKDTYEIVWSALRIGGASASAISGWPRRVMNIDT